MSQNAFCPQENRQNIPQKNGQNNQKITSFFGIEHVINAFH